MAMMTPSSHQLVDIKLQEAIDAIETAQDAASSGADDFDSATDILYECRTLIDQETENDAVIGHLKSAAVELDAFSNGAAAASVRAAIGSIKALVEQLPD